MCIRNWALRLVCCFFITAWANEKVCVITAILILCFNGTRAQDLPSGTEQQLENLSDVTEEETEDDAYLQQLQYYTLHPLNINEATREELQALRC
jgi:DNA uptake protein ComE-like DNA-binding protein